MATATATCHTEDCANADMPLEVTVSFPDMDTGEETFVGSVGCGVCGQPITDVVPPLPGTEDPDPEDVPDNTLPTPEGEA